MTHSESHKNEQVMGLRESEQSDLHAQSVMRGWSIPAPLSVDVAESGGQWQGGLYYRSPFIVWTTTRTVIWFIA